MTVFSTAADRGTLVVCATHEAAVPLERCSKSQPTGTGAALLPYDRTATVAYSRLRRPRVVGRVGRTFPTGASAGLVT